MKNVERILPQNPEANPIRHEAILEQEYRKYFSHYEHSHLPEYDILNPYDYSKPVEAARGTGA